MNTTLPPNNLTTVILPSNSSTGPSTVFWNTSSESLANEHYTHIFLWLSSPLTQTFAGLCAFLACIITSHHIYCHLRYYTCFAEQKYIIRILLLVPAYALYSFMSIIFAVHARINSIYIEPIHDIAEAVTIYSFLALCYQYLGGEGSIMLQLNGKTIKSSCFYGTCCFAGKPYTILFLRFCKVATLQYALIKPFTSALSIILYSLRKYTVSDFRPTSGYLYLFLINNFTVTLALYGLLLFYFATRDQLRPFKPILKFATIKAIIFFSFWQDVLFSILEWSSVISGGPNYSAGLVAVGCKNFLICIELVFTAVALRYAFPYSIYVLHHPPRLILDFPLGGQDWNGLSEDGSFTSTVEFKPPVRPCKKNLGSLRADLLFGTAAFADRNPGFSPQQNQHSGSQQEPLPWDISDRNNLADDGEQTVWDSRAATSLATISAGLRETIDPRDILTDAVHNFHPTYRHYTQTKFDDSG